MSSGAENWILNKINELVLRFGLTPVQVDVQFSFRKHDIAEDFDKPAYALGIVDNVWSDEDREKVERISALLGVDEHGMRTFNGVAEANEAVDRALSLAPRARTR